jgi:hypothetical protein
METTRWADRLVFAAAQCWAVLRHPYLTLRFYKRHRRFPHYARPHQHTDMVQWRKIFDHDPRFTIFSDKLATKRWVAENFPDVKTAEVLWTGTRPEDLPQELIVPGNVIKASHGSRMNYHPDRQSLSRSELDRLMAGWLGRSYYHEAQWGYRHVPRRLFVERRIGGGEPLREYTFRAHDGVISSAAVIIDQHQSTERISHFAGDGRRLPGKLGQSPERWLPADYALPESYFSAMARAKDLSRGIDYVRVDFIVDGETACLCEMTVYPGSGFGREREAHNAPLIERSWFAALHNSWFLTGKQPWLLSLYQAAFRRWAEAHDRELAGAPPPAP